MTPLELYKFVTNSKSEYQWTHDKKDVILFVDIPDIAEFNKLLGSSILDEHGLDCVMKERYFCFEMEYICGYFGIELSEIFEPVEEP